MVAVDSEQNYVDKLRSQVFHLVEEQDNGDLDIFSSSLPKVQVKKSKIKSFVTDVLLPETSNLEALNQKSAFRTCMPLKFPDLKSEITMIALLNLLDFGRSYNKILMDTVSRNAQDTILFGCMGMHLSGKKLDADFLLGMTVTSVGQFFSIPVTVEEKVMDAVYKDSPGPLHPFADSIRKVMNDTGRVLKSLQVECLGEYILKVTTSHTKYKKSAVGLVNCLADTFPMFQDIQRLKDSAKLENDELPFVRKAQKLVLSLFSRFVLYF